MVKQELDKLDQDIAKLPLWLRIVIRVGLVVLIILLIRYF